MEKKLLNFDIKELDGERGIIKGHASVFNNIDLDNDIVEEGAFKKTIEEQDGKVPILKQHDWNEEIGMSVDLMEDMKGLFFEGQLYVKQNEEDVDFVPTAQSEYAKIKYRKELGKPMSMSFGFDVVDYDIDDEGVRHLKELKLWEISPVTFPANMEAGISSVKSQEELDEEKLKWFIQEIKEGRVLSSQNEQLIREAISVLQDILNATGSDQSDTDDDAEELKLLENFQSELEEMNTELRLTNFLNNLKE